MIRRHGDEFHSSLTVRSGDFACELPFIFSRDSLGSFRSELVAMVRTLLGDTVLRHPYEDSWLRLAATGHGHVVVTGELVESGEHPQSLAFEFHTDQMCLPGLVSDVEHLLQSTASN